MPAMGLASTHMPDNILPKLARALTDDIAPDGATVSVGKQVSQMIDRLAGRQTYDVVLVDSRAGLAEISAPAVLCLGALVLLFGTAQQQTMTGYAGLFSGLKLLALSAVAQGNNADWRLLFKPVYAKASLDPIVGERHAAELYELFAENLYDEEGTGSGAINFGLEDVDAPHSPLVIPFDPRFVDFDPRRNRSQLGAAFYEQTFRPFLIGLDQAIGNLIQAANSEQT
jgi:hypothetical protein